MFSFLGNLWTSSQNQSSTANSASPYKQSNLSVAPTQSSTPETKTSSFAKPVLQEVPFNHYATLDNQLGLMAYADKTLDLKFCKVKELFSPREVHYEDKDPDPISLVTCRNGQAVLSSVVSPSDPEKRVFRQHRYDATKNELIIDFSYELSVTPRSLIRLVDLSDDFFCYYEIPDSKKEDKQAQITVIKKTNGKAVNILETLATPIGLLKDGRLLAASVSHNLVEIWDLKNARPNRPDAEWKEENITCLPIIANQGFLVGACTEHLALDETTKSTRYFLTYVSIDKTLSSKSYILTDPARALLKLPNDRFACVLKSEELQIYDSEIRQRFYAEKLTKQGNDVSTRKFTLYHSLQLIGNYLLPADCIAPFALEIDNKLIFPPAAPKATSSSQAPTLPSSSTQGAKIMTSSLASASSQQQQAASNSTSLQSHSLTRAPGFAGKNLATESSSSVDTSARSLLNPKPGAATNT